MAQVLILWMAAAATEKDFNFFCDGVLDLAQQRDLQLLADAATKNECEYIYCFHICSTKNQHMHSMHAQTRKCSHRGLTDVCMKQTGRYGVRHVCGLGPAVEFRLEERPVVRAA